MTDTKHTPGPWVVNGKKSIRGPKEEYIANANWNNGVSNARLIAAAPELLDMLEEILIATAYDHGNDQLYKKVERTVAKAKGKTE